MSRDSNALRQYINTVTPDIANKVIATFKDGQQEVVDLPMNASFFFPGTED
jgi:hypothetical protein